MVKVDITREHRIWKGIKQRCLNPNNPAYPNYGGRGITLCQQWQDSFYQFYRDMGPCPLGFSIERLNVNDGYSPDNCVWASDSAQRLNKRTTRWVEYEGQRMPLRVFCTVYQLDYKLTHKRLQRGWTIEKCIDKPSL